MKYDIVITGGGTAGCACAYIAARKNLSVLLIEKNSFLGGAMTSALVTPAMNTSSDNINNSFYTTLMSSLHKIGGQITYMDGNIGWFNPELMKIVLDNLLDSAGVRVLLNSEIANITTEKKTLQNVTIKNYSDGKPIDAKYFVDATGDARIFQKLNCDFLENENGFQPCSLRFIMSGIDVDTFSDWIMGLDMNRNVTTSYLIDGSTHLSTACTWDSNKNWALAPIFKEGIKYGLIEEQDSNYFQIFSIAGMPASLAFNCPRILEKVNPDNSEDVSRALKSGRESILRLSNFFKLYFKGFENAYISSIANSLGIRVSNRIKGKYIYTYRDLKTGKIFKNPCVISDYPVDIHSSEKNMSVLDFSTKNYMLPIESLMSYNYDNLFAIGRCISADFKAQAALRIIPSCFSMGEGLAKYLANKDTKKNVK